MQSRLVFVDDPHLSAGIVVGLLLRLLLSPVVLFEVLRQDVRVGLGEALLRLLLLVLLRKEVVQIRHDAMPPEKSCTKNG